MEWKISITITFLDSAACVKFYLPRQQMLVNNNSGLFKRVSEKGKLNKNKNHAKTRNDEKVGWISQNRIKIFN